MEPTRHDRPFQIMVIDDNPGDVRLITEAFKESDLPKKLHTFNDGDTALAFLRQEGAPRPDFILMDLNLPRRDGRQLLVDIRDNDNFKDIPIVIFTSSQSDDDMAIAYLHQANCFVTKPVDFDEFIARIKAIERFWLKSSQKNCPVDAGTLSYDQDHK